MTTQLSDISDEMAAHEAVLQRAFEYWRNVDKDLGERVEKGVRAGQS